MPKKETGLARNFGMGLLGVNVHIRKKERLEPAFAIYLEILELSMIVRKSKIDFPRWST